MDWGLGHATRCVPLIKQLMADNVVVLGVTPLTRLILDEEFPALLKADLEPYAITYSQHVPLALKLLWDAPRIGRVIRKEHRQLQHLVQQYGIDVVISDNRFGLSHAGIETVYMTHQLCMEAGIFSSLANRIHHRFMRRFSQVWVPDFEAQPQSLAGGLSRHPQFKAAVYLGPLSRLPSGIEKTADCDYLLLLSGAEPQRSLLEEALCKQLHAGFHKTVLIRGTQKPLMVSVPAHVEVIDLPDAGQLAQCLRNAGTVVCRSGYSTLMDLHAFGKNSLILIPTPGQAEQQYLARYWKKNFGAEVLLQHDVSSLKW